MKYVQHSILDFHAPIIQLHSYSFMAKIVYFFATYILSPILKQS